MRNAADWFGLLAIGLIACGDEEELVAISEPTGPPIATPCALGDPGCDLDSIGEPHPRLSEEQEQRAIERRPRMRG